jgi:osmotically-inducible protein OsmY
MVKARLAQEKMSTLTKIQVDTDRNGAVFLSGKSKTQARTKKYRLPMQPRV